MPFPSAFGNRFFRIITEAKVNQMPKIQNIIEIPPNQNLKQPTPKEQNTQRLYVIASLNAMEKQ